MPAVNETLDHTAHALRNLGANLVAGGNLARGILRGDDEPFGRDLQQLATTVAVVIDGLVAAARTERDHERMPESVGLVDLLRDAARRAGADVQVTGIDHQVMVDRPATTSALAAIAHVAAGRGTVNVAEAAGTNGMAAAIITADGGGEATGIEHALLNCAGSIIEGEGGNLEAMLNEGTTITVLLPTA